MQIQIPFLTYSNDLILAEGMPVKCYLGKKRALLKCPCNLCVKHNVLSDVKYALNAGIVDTHALNRWKCNLGDPHMWEVTTKWIYFRVKGCQ